MMTVLCSIRDVKLYLVMVATMTGNISFERDVNKVGRDAWPWPRKGSLLARVKN
jgi:hypothetical protein